MTKATIINFDGNYSRTVRIGDQGETTNVEKYIEYHTPYQPKDFGIGYEVDIIDKGHPMSEVLGVYPPECVTITSDDPNLSGRKDWYIGLLPENLKIGKTDQFPNPYGIDTQTGRILFHQTVNFTIVPGFLFTCPACSEKVTSEHMDYYQYLCANCAQLYEEHQIDYEQDREQEWKRDMKYDKYRDLAAEYDGVGTKLMTEKDVYDQDLQDSAGFAYINVILQDGTSWRWGYPDGSKYYVTDLDLSQRTNQAKLIRWLRPYLLKALESEINYFKSRGLTTMMEDYFGRKDYDERTQQDLEKEYKQTGEYKLYSGKSPAVSMEVNTLFGGIVMSYSVTSGFHASGKKRHDLKPPILLNVYENPQTINNRWVG